MEKTVKTAQSWAMGDIMILSDLTDYIADIIHENTGKQQDFLVMGNAIEAVKITIENKHLLEKQKSLFREMSKRTEQAHFTGFEGSTLREFDRSDFLIPNDFWEQSDTKNRLHRMTNSILISSKLQYQ
jgi:predicted P-loop ATPase